MKHALLALLLLVPTMTAAVDVEERGHKVTRIDDDNQTAGGILERADSIFQTRDYEAALSLYRTAFEKARDEFNRSVETEALSQMARMNLILNRKEEGREPLAQAAERASDSDPMGWTRYLGVRGRFEWKDGDLATARATFDEMYEYCTSNALWSRAIDAAHMIAIVVETPEEQIEWGRKGIEAAEAAEQEQWLGPLWNNLATTYYDIKQYDSALSCFFKAREYHWRHSGETGKLFADYHVGMTYRLLGELDEAATWLRPVLAWAERLGNHSAIGQACEDLGEVALGKGDRTEGLKLLMRARDEYRKAGFDTSWPEVWDNINKRITEVED